MADGPCSHSTVTRVDEVADAQLCASPVTEVTWTWCGDSVCMLPFRMSKGINAAGSFVIHFSAWSQLARRKGYQANRLIN